MLIEKKKHGLCMCVHYIQIAYDVISYEVAKKLNVYKNIIIRQKSKAMLFVYILL